MNLKSVETPLERYGEDAIALAFAAKHAGELIFVPSPGLTRGDRRFVRGPAWRKRDDGRWGNVSPVLVLEMCRVFCRKLAREAGQDMGLSEAQRVSVPMNLGKYRTVAVVLELAKGEFAERAVAIDKLNMAAFEKRARAIEALTKRSEIRLVK